MELLDRSGELLSRTEPGDPARFDLNRLTRLRIAPHPRLPLGDRKGSESNEGDPLSLLEGLCDSIHKRIQSLTRGGFTDPNVLRDLLDEIRLVHGSPPGTEIWERVRMAENG